MSLRVAFLRAKKPASPRSLKSDLTKVDAHKVKPSEYKELPALTPDMLAHARVNKGGRPISANPRQLISLRTRSACLGA